MPDRQELEALMVEAADKIAELQNEVARLKAALADAEKQLRDIAEEGIHGL